MTLVKPSSLTIWSTNVVWQYSFTIQSDNMVCKYSTTLEFHNIFWLSGWLLFPGDFFQGDFYPREKSHMTFLPGDFFSLEKSHLPLFPGDFFSRWLIFRVTIFPRKKSHVTFFLGDFFSGHQLSAGMDRRTENRSWKGQKTF